MIVRLRALILIVVILLGAAAVSGQDVPSTISTALQQLSSLVGYPVTLQMLEAYTWESNTYSDTHLGCELAVFPAVTGNYFGYHFTLTLNGVSYDIRVSGDSSIVFPCIGDGGTSPLPGVTSVPAVVPVAELAPCPAGFAGYLPPQSGMGVGAVGRIALGGTPNRLRSAPSVLAPQIGVIQPGGSVTVLAGPSCEPQSVNGQANIIFWQVNTSGVIGWTAEGLLPDDYFFEVITAGTPPTSGGVSSDRAPILSSNAAQLTQVGVLPSSTVGDFDIGEGALNGQGVIAIAGGSSGARFFNATTLEEVTLIAPTSEAVNRIAVSDDGRFIAVAGIGNAFSLIDLSTGSRTSMQVPQSGAIEVLDFAPGANPLLAVGFRSDTNTGQLILMSTPVQNNTPNFPYAVTTTSGVSQLSFSPAGQLVWTENTAVNVLNLATMTLASGISIAPSTSGLPRVPAFSALPPGCTASTCPITLALGDDTRVRVINMSDPARSEVPLTLPSGLVATHISFSPDGSVLFVYALFPATPAPTPPTLLVYNWQSGTLIHQISFTDGASNAMAITPDGSLILLTGADGARLYGVPTDSDGAVG